MKLLFYIFVFLETTLSNNIHFKNFNLFMNQDGIVKMKMEFIQNQYDEEFKSTGDFYYFNKNYYIYDNPYQRIVYENNYITTINKIDKQVIYETAAPDDFTIFDFMNGGIDSLIFYDLDIFNDKIKMSFKIDEWLILGSLTTDILTGKPNIIEFNLKNLKTIIKVLEIWELESSNLLTIDTRLFSIINFRE